MIVRLHAVDKEIIIDILTQEHFSNISIYKGIKRTRIDIRRPFELNEKWGGVQ